MGTIIGIIASTITIISAILWLFRKKTKSILQKIFIIGIGNKAKNTIVEKDTKE